MSDHKFFYVLNNSLACNVFGQIEPLPKCDYLLSVWEAMFKGTGKKFTENFEVFKGCMDNLFIDSGMFSAIKQDEISWVENTDGVINNANKYKADICAMLDVPTYTDGTKKIFSQQESLDLTAKNASVFKKHGDVGMDKCYVLQGYDKKGYKKCIENFDKIDVWEDADYIGVGSIAWQSSNKIVQIGNFILPKIRDRTDAKIHFFGVGGTNIVPTLYNMGVYSCDSASLIQMSWRYQTILNKRVDYPPKLKFKWDIIRYLYVYNVLMHQKLIFDWADENQTSLFEYASEEVNNKVCDMAASNDDHEVMEEFVPFLPGDVL